MRGNKKKSDMTVASFWLIGSLLNLGIDKFYNPNYFQLENTFLQVIESFKHSNCKAFTICDSDSQQYQIFN